MGSAAVVVRMRETEGAKGRETARAHCWRVGKGIIVIVVVA